jgi:hypothetical protein
MDTLDKFEFIKNAVKEGKVEGTGANLIMTLIYAIAHAFFAFLIRVLIEKLIKIAESYGISVIPIPPPKK